MSYAEAPKDTVKRFSQSWNATDRNSLVAELLSVSNETNRRPDTYYFTLSENGELLDPNTGKPILDFVAEGVEKKVARDLQEWTSQTDEGMALWISPALKGVYPCPKIIIHKIAYQPDKTKVVLNSVILFDAEIENPEYKRGTLYTLPDSEINISKILAWVKRKSKEEVKVEVEDSTIKDKATHYANQIMMGIPHYQVIDEMQRSGFLGERPISCPSASNVTAGYSSFTQTESFGFGDQYGELSFSCPSCSATNTRPFGQLISNCQFCGADVRC